MSACFRKTNRQKWAHLCDDDMERLKALARRLGVKRIKVSKEGQRGQHIDLCGAPLRKAIGEARTVEFWETRNVNAKGKDVRNGG